MVWYVTKLIFLLFAGLSTIVISVWTTQVCLIICIPAGGFFSAAFGPTAAESVFLITSPRLFNFARGHVLVIIGVGWMLGTPAAGNSAYHLGSTKFDKFKRQAKQAGKSKTKYAVMTFPQKLQTELYV